MKKIKDIFKNIKFPSKKTKLSYKGKKYKRNKSLKISKRQKKQSFSYTSYIKNKDIKVEIEKRYNILTFIIIVFLLILTVALFSIQIIEKDKYTKELKTLTKKVVYGQSAPRGRIYDRNGKLIVDNAPSKVVYYKKPSKITTKKEIEIAYALADMISLDVKINDYDFKVFWIKNNPKEAKKKITKSEWKKLDERKLKNDDIYKLEIERVTEEDLSVYNDYDKKAAYIYTLMNTGYSYAEKVIKEMPVMKNMPWYQKI